MTTSTKLAALALVTVASVATYAGIRGRTATAIPLPVFARAAILESGFYCNEVMSAKKEGASVVVQCSPNGPYVIEETDRQILVSHGGDTRTVWK